MANARTNSQRLLLLVGSIGPLGHAPASGTVTVAVVGIPFFWWAQDWPLLVYFPVVVLFTGVSVWLHEVGDRILGEKDSRRLVWDELAGFMFAIVALPFTWQVAAVAFLAERSIDIVKVPPADWIERRWPGGWGVVGDDLIAGLYTCGLLHLLIYLWPRAFGLAI